MDTTMATKINNNEAIKELAKSTKRAKVSKTVPTVEKQNALDTMQESTVLAELKSLAEKLGPILSDVLRDLHACSKNGGKGGKKHSRDGDSMDTGKETGSDKNTKGATPDDVVVVKDGGSTWQQQADHTQDTALALTTADTFCVKAQAACEDVRSRIVQWRLVQMRASTGMYEDAHVVAALEHVQKNAALTTRCIMQTMEGMCNITVGMPAVMHTSHMQGAWQLLIARLSETLRFLLSSCFIVSLQPDLVVRKNVKVNVTASLLNGAELGADCVSSGVVCQITDEAQSRVIDNMSQRENNGDQARCSQCKMGNATRAPNPTFNTASQPHMVTLLWVFKMAPKIVIWDVFCIPAPSGPSGAGLQVLGEGAG